MRRHNQSMSDETPLDAAEWELWHALKTLSDTSLAAVGSALEAATGLSGADFGILTRLEDLGDGRVPQRELQAALGWDKSRLSHQLTRMERRGLLRRVHAAAGSGVCVEITQEGRTMIAGARPVHAAAVRQHLLQHIHPHEAAMILAMVSRMFPPLGKGA
jgi:DNA-binding MarR family transcriptional regulator